MKKIRKYTDSKALREHYLAELARLEYERELAGDRQPADQGGPPTQEQVDELADDLFTYHPPTPEQAEKYRRINEAAKAFFKVIHAECPESPDRTVAVRLVREARMTANASIATKSGGRYH